MSEAEKKRRQRQLATPAKRRADRIRRAFDAAGEDAQRLFIRWLKRTGLLK